MRVQQVALLALSFNRPILVPNIPSILEYKTLIQSNTIFNYTELNEEVILKTVDYLKKITCTINSAYNLDNLSWNKIAQMTKESYLTLLNNKQ